MQSCYDNIMIVSVVRILLVTSDPGISNYIFRQSLMPLGYHVYHVEKSSEVLRVTLQKNPDFNYRQYQFA